MADPSSRRSSGPPDQPNFRADAKLTGLEIWLNGTHDELDAALAALDGTGRLLWRSERRRLHGAGDQGRHSVYLRLAAAAPARPAPAPQAPPGGQLVDLAAARRSRASA